METTNKNKPDEVAEKPEGESLLVSLISQLQNISDRSTWDSLKRVLRKEAHEKLSDVDFDIFHSLFSDKARQFATTQELQLRETQSNNLFKKLSAPPEAEPVVSAEDFIQESFVIHQGESGDVIKVTPEYLARAMEEYASLRVAQALKKWK